MTSGLINMVADVPNDRITLLDRDNRHFATVTLGQYAEQIASAMPQTPAAAQSLIASMKMTADSKVTGRTETIQGIQAEEHEITISLGMPAMANLPSGPMMKVVLDIWMAKPEEVAANPALREFVASGLQTLGSANPTDSIQKVLKQFPGIADSMGSIMKEISSTHSVTLRMNGQIFMPMLAALTRNPGTNNPLARVNADAPLMEMTQELTKLSTAPVADSVFVIPEDYTSASVAEIMSAMQSKITNAAKAAMPSAAAARPPVSTPSETVLPPLQDGEYRVGNGVSAPTVAEKSDPGYTEEAKANKIEGSVILSVTVGADGKARNIQVVRSLDPGLDQKAVEAVGQWVFKPGTKDGMPVSVRAQIQLNFKLL